MKLILTSNRNYLSMMPLMIMFAIRYGNGMELRGSSDATVTERVLTLETACSACFGASSGPCQAPHNKVCYNYNVHGACPPSTVECIPRPKTGPHQCPNCNGGFGDGVCQHNNDRSCLRLNILGMCPPGTTRCCDEGYELNSERNDCLEIINTKFLATGKVHGGITYFGDGEDLPTACYMIAYEDGCMKYSFLSRWTVNSGNAGRNWYLGSTVGDQRVMLPGIVGWTSAPAQTDYAACVALNQASVIPVVYNHTLNGPLGVWLRDRPYFDNNGGSLAPTWSLMKTPCP